MNASQASGLRALLLGRNHAALATVHDGEPQVSMVPFALLPDASAFVIHVSGLAAHTAHMFAHPRIALLVTAPDSPEVTPQALPRVSIQADATHLHAAAPLHPIAKAAYLERFAQAAPIFELPDFSLFLLMPASLRLVLGFGSAKTLDAQDLRRALADKSGASHASGLPRFTGTPQRRQASTRSGSSRRSRRSTRPPS